MAENVKGLAMRYKHDGVVYELDSGKLVHTKGEQSIDGKKVFKTVPQVEGAPVEDNDVTNKKYVQDALDAFAAPKVASFTITAKNSANAAQGAAPVEINKLKIFLADGRRLDPVFMEEGDLKGSTEAKLLVLTLNKQDQSDLTPTKVAKTEIESYALKDGEFLGKLYPCKFFGQHQDMYSNSGYQDPWNQYWTTADRFWNENSTTSGQVRIDIFDIDQMVQKLTFTSTSSGREAVFTATANDGAKEENGDVQKKENHVFDIVFPKMGEMLSKPGPVLLSTNQVVKDVKTFATPPKSANAPVANDDVANKAYVDNLNNELKGYVDGLIQKPGFDIELQIGVTALASWNAFSQLNILLNNGKRLEAKYVEEGIKAGSDPAKVVLVMTDNPDAEIPEPELKQASFFDTYELGSNEYACEFYNANAMGVGNIHSDPRYANPWRAYLVEGISSGQKSYYLKLVIKQLQDAVSTVQFYCGDKHNGYGYPPKNFLFKASCNGVTTDEQVSKDNPSTKELIKFDIPADALPIWDNYVDLVSEQTISGVKTFAAVPKITAEPTDDTDAVNKKYIEKHFVSRPKYDFKIDITCEGNSYYVSYSELKINLTDGKIIEPLYLEKREVRPDNNIYRFVYKISDASAVTVKQTPRKSSSEMDAYQLQDGEYIGHLYYVGHFNSGCSMNPYDNQTDPWYGYLFNGGSGRLTMCQIILSGLPTDVTGIAFKSGDKHNSFGYKSTKYGAKFTYGKKSQEHELTNAQATHEFLVDSSALAPEAGNSGFVELAGDQSINGVKTFNAAPKSLAEAVDGNDLITKDFATKNFFARENSARDFDILVKMKNDGTWVGFTQFKVLLSNGTRLDIKYLESGSATTATQPLVAVFKTVTDSAAAITAPERKAKTFFDTYSLEDGEYKGTVSFYKVVGKFNPASADINPWNVYVGNGNANTYDGIYGLHIEQLDKGLKGVNFKFGDAVSTSSNYTCQQCGIVFTTNLGSLEVEYKGDMTDATEATIELPSNSAILGGFVTIENDQGIIGVKTFTKAPKCLASAVEDNDLVNKSYVDASFSPYAPQDWSVQISFGYTSGSFAVPDYTAFSHLKPLLVGGGRLEIKAVSSSISYIATDPINVIWKINPDADASFTEPQSMTDTNIKSYVLQKGEFRGTIIFAKHYGEATPHSSLYKPWQCYAAKANRSDQIIFGFTVEGLTVGLKAITFLMGDCRPENNNGGEGATNNFWAYHTYMKAISNNVEQVLDFRRDYGYAITQTTKQTLELDPHKSLPYISFNQAQKELVTIGTEQTVKAVKTFDKFPKVTSVYGNLVSTKEELVHRDYIDNNVPPALRTNTITLRARQPSAITRGQSFDVTNIKLVLKNGQCITPFIVDSAGMRDPTSPCPVIWKLVSYSDAVVAPTYKTADEINATKLSAGMYKGSYYPMNRLWSSTGSYANFTFDKFGGVASDGAGNGCDIFKVDIYGLDIPVDRIEFSRHYSSGQIGSLALLIAVDGSSDTICAYTPKEMLDGGVIKESDYVISVKANKYWKLPLGAGYTTLSSDQTIDGFKSFAKSVSCEVAPTEDAHLANKKYVDDELAKLVARIAALEAANP